MLEEVHRTRSAADQAADEHAEEVHPDQDAVLVLTVAQETVEGWLEDVLELAARAQHGVRVDGTPRARGRICEGGGGGGDES